MKKRLFYTFLLLLEFQLIAATAIRPALYYKARGDYYLHRKEISNAILEYQKAIRIQKHFPECYYQIAKIYMKTGMYTFAIKNYIQVIINKKQLNDKTMLLDSYLALATAHYIQAEKKIGRNSDPDYKAMNKYVTKVIDAFSKDPDFMYNPKKIRQYRVNRHHYLAKAYFIIANRKRILNQSEQYHLYFKKCINHLKHDLENYFSNIIFENSISDFTRQLIVLKKRREDEWRRAQPKLNTLSKCYYYLWSWNFHKRNLSKAKKYLNNALLLNPNIIKMPLDRVMYKALQKSR